MIRSDDTKKGCFGLSLQRTCLILGIISIIICIISTIGEVIYLKDILAYWWSSLAIRVTFIIGSAFISLAAILENKYLLYPCLAACVIGWSLIFLKIIYEAMNLKCIKEYYKTEIFVAGAIDIICCLILIVLSMYGFSYHEKLAGTLET